MPHVPKAQGPICSSRENIQPYIVHHLAGRLNGHEHWLRIGAISLQFVYPANNHVLHDRLSNPVMGHACVSGDYVDITFVQDLL